MTSAYKPLLSMFIIFCFCCACAHEEKARTMGAVTSASAGEVSAVRLQAPIGLTLRIVPVGFLLSWSPSPQDQGVVAGYEIVRATYFSGPYETVGTVGKGVFNFVDRTAKPEAIYFYKVRAAGDGQYSPFSGEVSGEMPGKP